MEEERAPNQAIDFVYTRLMEPCGSLWGAACPEYDGQLRTSC
jgi:hypothetical protein